jgi:hypothetical protein
MNWKSVAKYFHGGSEVFQINNAHNMQLNSQVLQFFSPEMNQEGDKNANKNSWVNKITCGFEKQLLKGILDWFVFLKIIELQRA